MTDTTCSRCGEPLPVTSEVTICDGCTKAAFEAIVQGSEHPPRPTKGAFITELTIQYERSSTTIEAKLAMLDGQTAQQINELFEAGKPVVMIPASEVEPEEVKRRLDAMRLAPVRLPPEVAKVWKFATAIHPEHRDHGYREMFRSEISNAYKVWCSCGVEMVIDRCDVEEFAGLYAKGKFIHECLQTEPEGETYRYETIDEAGDLKIGPDGEIEPVATIDAVSALTDAIKRRLEEGMEDHVRPVSPPVPREAPPWAASAIAARCLGGFRDRPFQWDSRFNDEQVKALEAFARQIGASFEQVNSAAACLVKPMSDFGEFVHQILELCPAPEDEDDEDDDNEDWDECATCGNLGDAKTDHWVNGAEGLRCNACNLGVTIDRLTEALREERFKVGRIGQLGDEAHRRAEYLAATNRELEEERNRLRSTFSNLSHEIFEFADRQGVPIRGTPEEILKEISECTDKVREQLQSSADELAQLRNGFERQVECSHANVYRRKCHDCDYVFKTPPRQDKERGSKLPRIRKVPEFKFHRGPRIVVQGDDD